MSLQSRLKKFAIPLACLCLGAFGAVVVWGRGSDDREQLAGQLRKFQALNSEQQNTVLKSYSLLQGQPETRRAEIEEIFRATQQNPELKSTMDQYFVWWSGLSETDRDNFRSDLNPEEKLEFVASLRASQSTTTEEIIVEFPGPPSVRLPTLHLTFEEFWTIISSAIPPSRRNEKINSRLDQLSSNKHRALCLALGLFESFQGQGESRDLEDRGRLFSKVMLENIKDKAWTTKFHEMTQEIDRKPQARPWAGPWLYMTLFTVLEKATLALGEDLRKQFSVTPEEMVTAFASLQNKSEAEKSLQRTLMTMSSDEARKRLELLAQTDNAHTPEELLLTQYNEFIQKRQSYMRRPFGFGAPGMNSDRPRPPGSPQGSDRPSRPPSRRTPGE